MRILVVEDEPTLQAQLATALTAASHAVDCAGNGVDEGAQDRRGRHFQDGGGLLSGQVSMED